MQRKIVITWLIASIAVAAAAEKPAPTPARQPNILWVVSEDNTANYVGAYGDPLALTPNLDRLAREGIVFDRAHSTAPVCAPARSSIITGCYATSLGTQHMRSERALPAGVKFFPEYLRAAGYFCTNNAKTDYNTSTPFAAAWDENGKTAHWRHRQPGQPFFAVFNFEESHEGGLWETVPSVTDPAKVKLPAYLPDTPATRAETARYYDCVSRADEGIGQILAQLAEDGLAEDTIVFYYSDNGGVIPRSKRFIYENGTHVAMILRFPEKFRDLAVSAPGTHLGELVNFVDLAPTVLSLAGLPQPAQFQGRPFAGPARQPAPAYTYTFRDRMDERYDLCRAATNGRWRYVRNYRPELPILQRISYLWESSTMKDWERLHNEGTLNAIQESYFNPKPPEELFDCENDPDNVHNLAADPSQQERLKRMRAANRAHLLSIRDTGFWPEAMMVEQCGGKRSPREISANDGNYPLARLLDFVDAVQLGDANSRAAIEAASQDPLPVVRYWAALAAAEHGSGEGFPALLRDSDRSVQVAAAYATVRRGNPDAAWPVFTAALGQKAEPELQLAALDFLALLPLLPAGLEPAIIAAAEGAPRNFKYVARAAEPLVGRTFENAAAPRRKKDRKQ